MKNFCILCNRPVSGRSDKKFCNDTCRVYYHNSKNSKTYFMKMINKSMVKNRNILKNLMNEGLNLLPKKELEYCGFSFRALTGVEQTEEGNYKLLCYDFYLIPEGNGFLIAEDSALYFKDAT